MRVDLLRSESHKLCLIDCQVTDTVILAGWAYFEAGLEPEIAIWNTNTMQSYRVRVPKVAVDCPTWTSGSNVELERI